MKAFRALKSVYSLKYLLLNLIILLVYYLLVEKLLSIQSFGIPIATAPVYLILALSLTSSVLMTVAIHSIVQSRKSKKLGYEDAASSCATAVVGGIMSGCGCQGAILYSALALLFGSGEAYAINTVFSEHIGIILAALSIFNIALIVYSLSRLPGGRSK